MQESITAIHRGMRLLSSAVYPREHYFRWQDGLISEREFLDAVLVALNEVLTRVERAPLVEGDCSLHLSDDEYDRLKKWIERTVAYKKAKLYYENGIRDDCDRLDYIDYIQFKALVNTEQAIDSEDIREARNAANISLRITFDDEAIKEEVKRNEALSRSKARYLEQEKTKTSRAHHNAPPT